MTLEALRKDMVAAMKAKDKTTKDAVSSLVSGGQSYFEGVENCKRTAGYLSGKP